MSFKQWRNPILTAAICMAFFVGTTQLQAQDVGWETRFNHTLGISFELPRGYELTASSVLTYSNGNSIIQFDAQPSRRIHRRTLDEACTRLASQTPGYDYEIVNGGKQSICLYTSDRHDSFTTIIADDSRETPGGQRYDYLVITAPEDALIYITESIAFEEDVSALLYLDEALRLVRANYVYTDAVNWDDLYRTALESVDQFSSLEEARQALKNVFTTLNGFSAHKAQILAPDELESSRGYGFDSARLADDNFLTVTLVYPNSPADNAGLQVGDQIYTINGTPIAALPEPDGTQVIRLEVQRPSKSSPLNFRLVPDFYNTALDVIGRNLPEKIGYIETYTAGIAGGGFDYSDAAQQLIRKIDQKAMCGWIVDVRRNPGGQALVMSLALAPLRGDGRWFGLKDITGDVSWYTYDFDSFPEITDQLHIANPYVVKTEDPPIAVLVSPYTASMGEMTAYIFKSREAGETRIFGEATGGYLSDGLSIIPLFDGAIMDIVTALSITPQGEALPKYIEPDVVIPTDYSVYGTDADPVIQAAKAWLAEQPECEGQQSQNPSPDTQGTLEIRFVATSGGVVNVRSGPGTDNAILIKLPNGTRLEVIDRSADGEWLYVRFEGGEGWISAALTRAGSPLQKQ